jgi:hypothetical protein
MEERKRLVSERTKLQEAYKKVEKNIDERRKYASQGGGMAGHDQHDD